MTAGIPSRVRDFLVAHIDSIELLEALLLLAARPQTAFTTVEVSDHLRSAPSSVATRLSRLRDHKLIDVLPGDRYRVSADPALKTLLAEVAQTYRDWRGQVVTLIYSQPSDVVRVSTDAFLIKKGEK